VGASSEGVGKRRRLATWSSQDSVDTLASRSVGFLELLGARASEMAVAA